MNGSKIGKRDVRLRLRRVMKTNELLQDSRYKTVSLPWHGDHGSHSVDLRTITARRGS